MAKRQKPGLRQRQEAPGLCFLGALIPLPAPGTEGSLDFGPLRIHCPPVCAAGQDHLVSNVLEHIDIRARITAHPMGPAPPLVKIDAVPACHFPPQLLLRVRSDLRRLCQSHIPLRAAGEEMQPNIDKNRSERRAGRVAKPRFFLSLPHPSQGVSILIDAVFSLMCRFSLVKRKGQRFSYLKTAVPGRWYAMVSQG